jgi:hypothetical protein
VIAALYAATYSDRAMRVWWNGMSPSTIRARLHGWRAWANYCQEETVTPQDVKQAKDPVSLIVEFVAYMEDVNTPDSYRTEAIPAVKELFGILGATQGLAGHDFLKSVIRSTARRVHQQSKYRQIWDIGILFDHIRNGIPSEKLPGSLLQTTTVALLMALCPCDRSGLFDWTRPRRG